MYELINCLFLKLLFYLLNEIFSLTMSSEPVQKMSSKTFPRFNLQKRLTSWSLATVLLYLSLQTLIRCSNSFLFLIKSLTTFSSSSLYLARMFRCILSSRPCFTTPAFPSGMAKVVISTLFVVDVFVLFLFTCFPSSSL